MTRLSPAGLGLPAALAGGAAALPWLAATARTDETTTAWPTGIPAAALADVDACPDRGGPVDRSAAACDRAATLSSGLGSPLEAALLWEFVFIPDARYRPA